MSDRIIRNRLKVVNKRLKNNRFTGNRLNIIKLMDNILQVVNRKDDANKRIYIQTKVTDPIVLEPIVKVSTMVKCCYA